VIAVLVALVLIVSSVAGLYYLKYSQVQEDNSIYLKQLDQLNAKYDANILIDFGNGTNQWYNDTSLQPGANLYTATVTVTNGNVNATCCEFGSHFVNGIGGVQDTSSKYWWLWTYDQSNSTSPWQVALVGVDEIVISNGAIYAWTFCGSTPEGNPTCSP
jgi:hypothetical protein